MYNTDLTCPIGIPKSKNAWTRSAKDYRNEINKRYVPLTKDETHKYIRLIRANDANKQQYIDKIIDSLGPVIMRCALQFAEPENYMDYVQEGACIVINCIYGYNLSYNNKTSFLAYCIHSIFNGYGTIYTTYHSTITYSARITNHVIVGLQRYCEMVTRRTGIPPTEDDIKEYCESVQIPYVPSMMEALNMTSIDSPGRRDNDDNDSDLSLACTISNHDASLNTDSWVSSYDNTALINAIRAAYGNYVERACKKQNSKINKERMLRDLEILFDYYGVEGREPLNVNQLGEKYNMNRERARQIVAEMPGILKDIVAKNSSK